MKKALLLVVLLASGCGPKTQTRIAPFPVHIGPPEDDVAYREGMKAFREGTPEGYERAVAAFRKADKRRPSTCEYEMHLAESLFFLVLQQKNNWEDFQPHTGEADAILFFKRGAPECNAFESAIARLQALSMSLDNFRQTEVVAMIRHAIDTDPDDPMNWIVLAQVNPDPLVRVDPLSPGEHAAELAPDLPAAQYEAGNYYLRNQSTFGRAKEAFERAVALNPRHFPAIIGIVYALSIEGDDAADKVEPLLKKAAEIAPNSLKARTLLGDYYAGLEETDLAVEQYQAAVTLAPAYYPAHLARGTALVTAERPDEAEKSFNEVIRLDVKRPHPPHNGVDFTADGLAHYYLGNIWLERGDLSKAAVEYTITLNDIGNHAGAIYGLGIIAYRQGRVDEALMKLNQVLEIDANRFPNAFLARGGIRAERKQFVESIADFDRAIEIYKQQAASLEAKARIDEQKGRIRKAEGERRRKFLIETTLEKALESKKTVETLKGGHPFGVSGA